jgi:hypothetical protein
MELINESQIIIYQSSMTFHENIEIDVMIVCHTDVACLEVITFNSTLNVEAPRIFIDLNLLKTKFENEGNFLIFESTSESSGTRKTELLNIIYYITSRIVTPNVLQNPLIVRLSPTSQFDVMVGNHLDIVYNIKPNHVIRHITPREIAL